MKTKYLAGLVAGVSLLAASTGVMSADSTPAASPVPAIESWDQAIDGIRNLAPQMLARLPKAMQDDPQVRQEVARLALESLATQTIEAIGADTDHPMFLPWGNVVLNVGQPNADTTYRYAKITPSGTYRLRGTKGSLRISKMAQFGKAKVEGIHSWVYTITYDDINTLHADDQGRFDVILSPTRPAGYTGDWWKLDPATAYLMIRMVSDDWTKEKDPAVSIERVDAPATRPRPSAAELEQRLKALPAETAMMAQLLVRHVVDLEDAGYVNKFKILDLTQIGGQLTGQFYYEGAYNLKDNEALIIESKVPEHCGYSSLILTNEIYETTDWYNNHSSLNDSQLKVDKDGILRVVVSAKDPGVPNWLDTAGYPRGAIQGRWTDCTSQPLPTIKKVTFAAVRKHFPKDTPVVTAKERDTEVRDRRAILQQRPLW